MKQRFLTIVFWLAIACFAVSHNAAAQGNQHKIKPNPAQEGDDALSVETEEIKLNVLARNDFGHFDPTLVKDDLMVVENLVPHQIASLQRVPASVLIVLDTGGEMRFAKNLKTTTQVAHDLIKELNAENQLALMQYSDKPEILCEWTTDKNLMLDLLAAKANFGKRSRFVEAMNMAVKFMQNRPNENRHLVLITDGMDSASDRKEREKTFQKLIAANVSVHVLSYTLLEQQEESSRSILRGGDGRAQKRTPEEHKITLPQPIQDAMRAPTIATINLDREMIRKARERQEALLQSQIDLQTLAKETGGAMILPKKIQEMIEKSKEVAATIDSQYVVTYIPKRALADSPAGTLRDIEVISRRIGLSVTSRRKVVVPERAKENQ